MSRWWLGWEMRMDYCGYKRAIVAPKSKWSLALSLSLSRQFDLSLHFLCWCLVNSANEWWFESEAEEEGKASAELGGWGGRLARGSAHSLAQSSAWSLADTHPRPQLPASSSGPRITGARPPPLFSCSFLLLCEALQVCFGHQWPESGVQDDQWPGQVSSSRRSSTEQDLL